MAQLVSPEKSPFSGRRVLLAGVAAAALMGVGLGLWARPAMSERQLATAPAARPAPEARRTLQIVIDDTPAPPGAPIELLPALPAPVRVAAPPERLAPEPMAPVRPPAGLVRVQAVEQEPVEPAPPRKATPKPAAKIVKVVEKPKPVAKARPAIQVKAPVARPKPPHLEKVKVVEKPQLAPQKVKLAKAEAKPVRSARDRTTLAKLDRHAKPAPAEKVAAPKPAKLRGVMHAIARAAPHKVDPPPKLQPAKVERRAVKPLKPHIEKTVVKARPVKPRVEKVVVKARPPVQAAPVRPLKPARGAGPLRLAKYTPQPDPTIRNADRQMSRAYSSARAAGVPDWQLRRQQQRWEAARASAAREAPWAVHDVYLARIAELHDLTRDAEGN